MKGIIVAAGYGTRFLPVTKTLPKELLPLLNKPSLAFIVEEFLASGIRDIIIITSRRKRTIEDYLDREVELETLFNTEGAQEKLAMIRPYDANFSFVRQVEMRGTGHALLAAKPFLDNEPTVVAYPDDLHFGSTPLTAQLIETWQRTQCCVMASLHNPPHLERYGVLKLASDGLHVDGIVEKPDPGQEPSQEASLGRYLYLPEFFDHLEEGWKNHQGKEYFHVFALERMMKLGKVVFHPMEGERWDTGDLAGYFQATLRYARQFPELVKILKHEAQLLD